jgi:adenylate cyclase
MLGSLVPCGGGDPIPLTKTRVLIGRERPCEVLLRYKNVSARHCELQLDEGYWFVRDLDSTNGIRVNGLPCKSKHVMPRDVLSVADHRFTLVYTPQTDRPPPEPERPMHLLEGSIMEQAGLPTAAKRKKARSSAAEQPEESTQEDQGAAATPNLGELVPCGGGESLPLLQPKVVIGRSGRCDIVLRYATVSSRHCELEMIDGFWHVQDLGSHNGIRVDGERCQSKLLKPLSVLSIATYRYGIVYTAPDEEPPDEEALTFARGLLHKAGLVRRKK